MESEIRVVLVETSHPGNIGASARAMKTMGLHRLVLVDPWYFPHAEATAMASGADDILAEARVCTRLDEALDGCGLIIGSTARPRRYGCPSISPRQCGERVAMEAPSHPVALVFGREKSGLTNEEIAACHYLVEIPANPEYASLNLAAAVQVLAYEVYSASWAGKPAKQKPADNLAPYEEMERLYAHLEQALIDIEFLYPDNPRYLMRRLRHLFNRARLDQNEVNILRGILTMAQRKAGREGAGKGRSVEQRQDSDPEG